MCVLWQTRNAYRTYQKCDVCSVADQNCVQDIPEMHTGYIYISEMQCMSCGRPEMCTGHTRNVMHVLWQTRISICPRVLQNLPCWKTQKTRNLFQHKILISVLSLSVSCCMRRLLQWNWPLLSHRLSFHSFLPPPSLPPSLLTPLPPVPPPSFPCPPPSYPPYPSPSPAPSILTLPPLPLSPYPSPSLLTLFTPSPSPAPSLAFLSSLNPPLNATMLPHATPPPPPPQAPHLTAGHSHCSLN